MTQTAPSDRVHRRRVFYIPGYDPFPPRRYRELYRKEGAAQAEISGYRLALRPKTAAGDFGWYAGTVIGGEDTEAEIDVLLWSDIVQASMARTIPATYWELVRTAWIYGVTGTLRRLMWMRKGPVIAALYPVGVLLLQLVLAYVAARLVGGAVLWLVRAVYGLFTAAPLAQSILWYPAMVLAGGAGLALFVWLMRWFKAQDGRIFAHYLMHDYAFSARLWGATPPELDARMDDFSRKIGGALASDVDEVLVVGHSSGAHLAVSILADLIRAGLPDSAPRLAFLSLGQVVPMVSFLPQAKTLRGDLAYLSVQEAITWVDVTAPGDGCAFALCDPVAVSGVAPPGQRWPLVVSAAFTQTLKPETWAKLRWRFFRLHFQYLCAFDNPGDYDYFQITAGPLSLAARYRDRKPSASRIDVPVAKYRTIA